MNNLAEQAVDEASVLDDEAKYVTASREQRTRAGLLPETTGCPEGLVGLALSGGGIRSATFQLGVLQALAATNILAWIDYFSAVSGGGYISAWLVKWISIESLPLVLQQLRARPGSSTPPQVHWLRENSSYLTPRLGLLGPDFSLFLTTYVHNLVRNLMVIVLAASVLMLLPRLGLAIILWIGNVPEGPIIAGTLGAALALTSLFIVMLRLLVSDPQQESLSAVRLLAALVFFCFLSVLFELLQIRLGSWCVAIATITLLFYERPLAVKGVTLIVLGVTFAAIETYGLFKYWCPSLTLAALISSLTNSWWNASETSTLNRRRFVAISVISSFYLLFVWIFFDLSKNYVTIVTYSYPALVEWYATVSFSRSLVLTIASVLTLICFLIYLITPLANDRPRGPVQRVRHFLRNPQPWLVDYATAVGAAFIAFYVIYRSRAAVRMIRHLVEIDGAHAAFVHTFVFLVPLCVFAGNLSFNIVVGLSGRAITPYKRERISAIAAQIYVYQIVAIYISVIALYGPLLSYQADHRWQVAFWGLCLAAFVGSIISWRHPSERRNAKLQVLVFIKRIAPYIVLSGVLILVASMLSSGFFRVEWKDLQSYVEAIYPTLATPIWPITAFAAMIASTLAVGFGTNLSSMHLFYQARLAWAYLGELLPGAPRQLPAEMYTVYQGKQQQPTNIQDLAADPGTMAPYLILNAALNLVGGDELAWQERKAANFIFSPKYCGFDVSMAQKRRIKSRRSHLLDAGYAPTAAYDRGAGISLAMAMAISGSALSANMGQHTSARVRFLHTLLNLRLGWWLGNPRFPGAWKSRQPGSGATKLLSELLGTTNEIGPDIFVSDGGHFENLGLYELVRRKCRVIIVSDCSEDAEWKFEGLGNAIERCRIDFGVEVNLEIADLIPGEHGYAKRGWTIGTITWPAVKLCSYIIYIKAVPVRGLPIDVWSYGRRRSEFPNHPTTDQWFTESQFESYRAIGEQIAKDFGAALQNCSPNDREFIVQVIKLYDLQQSGRQTAAAH